MTVTVWDLLRRQVAAALGEHEARATASSRYTVETIDRRVAELRARPQSPVVLEELAYLERVRAKRLARDGATAS